MRGQTATNDAYKLFSAWRQRMDGDVWHHASELAILASAMFVGGAVPLPDNLQSLWQARSTKQPTSFTTDVLNNLLAHPVVVTRAPAQAVDGWQATLSEVLQAWSSHFRNCHPTSARPWACWTPVAVAIAKGQLAADILPCLHGRKANPYTSRHAQLAPHRQVVLYQNETLPVVRPPDIELASYKHFRPRRGFVRAYSSEAMLNAQRACLNMSNLANAHETAANVVRFYNPRDWSSMLSQVESQGHTFPLGQALRTGRLKIDMAAMLARRAWYRLCGPTYRYIGVDASPQPPGLEVLVTVERVIRRADVHCGLAIGDIQPPIEDRRLPIAVLGHGRCSLADKVMAHIHQTWLDYGPSLLTTRAANADVRQVITDMGTEIGMCDYPDVTESALAPVRGRHRPARPSDSLQLVVPGSRVGGTAGLLYPLALGVPGIQHILDAVIQDGLRVLECWPTWQSSAKVVCQWMANQGHRIALQDMMRKRGCNQDLVNVMDKSVASFAHWRWKTLSTVTDDLARIEASLRNVLSYATVGDLACKEEGLAANFLAIGRDPSFWATGRILGDLVRPVHRMASWLGGCPCHEEQLRRGERVSCRWKGCRAPELPARIGQLVSELDAIRQQVLTFDEQGHIATHRARVATRMLAILRLKMQWVNEPPHLIWQARDSTKAKEFIAHHDNLVAQGQTPHRVSQHFCGPASPFRGDFERHASGLGMSAVLSAEVASYEICILDDTWVESSHRDMSSQTKKHGGSIAFRSASMRLRQSIGELDAIREFTNRDFLDNYKAIGQPATLNIAPLFMARKLRFQRLTVTVYRVGSEGMVNAMTAFGRLVRQPTLTRNQRSTELRLKVDYIHAVANCFGPQVVLSLPTVPSSVVESVVGKPWPQAFAELDKAADNQHKFFQVIMGSEVKRKKTRVKGARGQASGNGSPGHAPAFQPLVSHAVPRTRSLRFGLARL